MGISICYRMGWDNPPQFLVEIELPDVIPGSRHAPWCVWISYCSIWGRRCTTPPWDSGSRCAPKCIYRLRCARWSYALWWWLMMRFWVVAWWIEGGSLSSPDVHWWFFMIKYLRWSWHDDYMKNMINNDMTRYQNDILIDGHMLAGGINPSWEGVLRLCNCGQIPLWKTHLIEIMIALHSSVWQNQNRPKDNSNKIREHVLMKESPHVHIW